MTTSRCGSGKVDFDPPRIKLDTPKLFLCGICREKLKNVCLVCCVNKIKICPTVAGQCGHVYHKCCIEYSLKTRQTCPLDFKPWNIALPKNPKRLTHLCHKVIGNSVELVLLGAVLGPTVVTDEDWKQIYNKINKPKYLYTFKKPEHMSPDALKVLQIQFKTPTRCQLEHVDNMKK